MKIHRASCRIKASDEWYPTGDDGCIELRFHKNRLSLSGDDDFLMTKDGDIAEFRRISRMKSMSKDKALKLGFTIF